MKKITLYVDEQLLNDFDETKPQELSRAEAIRGLMANFLIMRTNWNNVAGIIVGKPKDLTEDFIIQVREPFVLKDKQGRYIRVSGGLVKVSAEEVMFHNLALGNYVTFGEQNWREVKEQ